MQLHLVRTIAQMLASMRIVDGGHLSDEDVTEALCDRGSARVQHWIDARLRSADIPLCVC